MLASDGIKIHIHESSRNDSLRGIVESYYWDNVILYYIMVISIKISNIELKMDLLLLLKLVKKITYFFFSYQTMIFGIWNLLDPIARSPIFSNHQASKIVAVQALVEGTARIPRFRVLTFKLSRSQGPRTSFVSRILIEHRHGRTNLYTRVSRVSWRLSVSRPSIPFPFLCSDSNPADRYQGSLEPTAGKAVYGRPYRWIIIMHEFREPVARVCWRPVRVT